MSFHSKMVKLRKFNGFTQETFAAEVGVSRQSVYKWETGQSYPEVEKLLKIARVFHVTVDDLLNDELDINRKGQAVPVEEVVREEEELRRLAEEKRRRRAENKARREAEAARAAAEAEAPVAEEPVAPVAEEPKAKEPVAPVAEAPKAEAKEEKKPGFFGRLFGRR